MQHTELSAEMLSERAEKPDVKKILLELLLEPTERDKQVKVGASNFAQPCPRCLADALSGVRQEQGYARMGAVIGTAVHDLLDKRVQELHPTWEPEQRVYLGTLPGYGDIKSTTDLYIPELLTCVDWKTTTKAKLVFIKAALTTEPNDYEITAIAEARYKVLGYLYQLFSYARGLELAGKKVEWVSLGFVCRDAVGDKDIWAWTTEYDPDAADKVWNRLERLWEALQGGLDPASLTSHPRCYNCNHNREGN